MAYEYESRISNSIDRDKNYFFTTTSKDMKDELQEVYRKAKAWDNYIAEVRERVKITVNTDDDVERETQKVIDHFMEDE